jgi:hypothetical protein
VAGVGQPQEPFMPGSGARLPAELRLVLAGYAGIACAWFATALACATAFASLFFFGDDFDRYTDMVLGDNGLYWLLFILAFSAFLIGASVGLWLGLWRAFKRSRRVSGFPSCFGGPAIHARPR